MDTSLGFNWLTSQRSLPTTRERFIKSSKEQEPDLIMVGFCLACRCRQLCGLKLHEVIGIIHGTYEELPKKDTLGLEKTYEMHKGTMMLSHRHQRLSLWRYRLLLLTVVVATLRNFVLRNHLLLPRLKDISYPEIIKSMGAASGPSRIFRISV